MKRFRLPVVLLALQVASVDPSLASESISLASEPYAWASPVRITTRLRIAGELTPEGGKSADAASTPVRADVELSYRQEALKQEPASERRVMRLIDSLKTGSGGPGRLTSDRRSLIARSGRRGAIIAAAEGPLTRSELDLAQLPADPLDLGALLPPNPVREGGTWKVETSAIEAVLRIRADRVCEVTAIVTEVSADFAKLRFAGPVHGRVDGAECEIDLRGVGLFDRNTGRLSRLNLGWKENRKVGPATPALQATAKLNLEIQALEESERIGVTDLLLAETASIDERLEVVTGDGGWRLLADRDWFVVARDRHATTLRQVADDRIVVATTLTHASGKAAGAEAFEREVRYSLGDRLASVVSTTRGETGAGDALLEIASIGSIDNRPVSWRHTQIATANGALSATATLYDDVANESSVSARRLLASAVQLPRKESTADAAAPAVRR